MIVEAFGVGPVGDEYCGRKRAETEKASLA